MPHILRSGKGMGGTAGCEFSEAKDLDFILDSAGVIGVYFFYQKFPL